MPDSRNEAILENILGADNDLLPPFSRIEKLLLEIYERGVLSMPVTAGTYALKVTVEDGEPVYEWVTITVTGGDTDA